MNSPISFLGMPGLPPDLSTHGYELDSLTYWIHVLMAFLFVGWGAFFLYTLVRFRKGRNPKASYEGVKSHVSSYLELAVAVVEVVLLFGLAIPLWADRVNVDFLFRDPATLEVTEDVFEVRVVAQTFAWNVHYPGKDRKFGRTNNKRVNEENFIGLVRKKDDPNVADDLVTQDMLVIPVGRPVLVHLSSFDVIHSFFLPNMRVKHDAIPGMVFPLWFEALKTSSEAKREIYDEKLAAGDAKIVEAQAKYESDLAAGAADLVHPSQNPEVIRDFEIACAQLCGSGHFDMRGTFKVVTQEEFDAWLEKELTGDY